MYQVDVLKWHKDSFISDKTLYPSYFTMWPSIIDKGRSVPDAAYYWYYLADSLLKAEQYEAALHAINEGMERSMMVPGMRILYR